MFPGYGFGSVYDDDDDDDDLEDYDDYDDYDDVRGGLGAPPDSNPYYAMMYRGFLGATLPPRGVPPPGCTCGRCGMPPPAPAPPEDSGGYDADFVEPVPAGLQCPVCLNAMRVPTELRCGHDLCASCLRQLPSGQCPVCRAKFYVPDDVWASAKTARLVLDLRVRCRTAGCEWTGELRALEAHNSTCGDKPCTGCKKPFPKTALAAHAAACPAVLVSCACRLKMPRRELEEHQQKGNCSAFKTCGGCGKRDLVHVIDSPAHRQSCVWCPSCATEYGAAQARHLSSVCPHRYMQCPAGCGVTLKARNVPRHRSTTCSKSASKSCGECGQLLPAGESVCVALAECKNCSAKVRCDRMGYHVRERCAMVTVGCANAGCNGRWLRKDYPAHANVCKHLRVECVYHNRGCRLFVQRHQLRNHEDACPHRFHGDDDDDDFSCPDDYVSDY